jgi:transposase
MPSWSSREELVHQVVLLTRQGMGVRSVARSLGVVRNTVRKLLTPRRVNGGRREGGGSAWWPHLAAVCRVP